MPDKAYCKFCKKEMTAVITALKKHQATAFHKKQAQLLHGESSMSRIDSMWREQNDSTNSVKEAEIRLAAFLSEHNISFNVMDHLSDLLPKLFPDSNIANAIKCKRTKTKCIIRNALAPHFHQELVNKLCQKPFSLIIDETTDISTHKELALVTRQYDEQSMTVKCSLYELVEVTGGSAEQLFQAITRAFETDSISFENLIGFAADTTNVMFGEHNSVVSRLKQKVPDLFVLRCICHSAHLCASKACEKLPRTVEDIIHDVYNYFAHSAKRLAEFKQFQYFAETEPHRLLRPCQTRWLSLHSCVSRLVEQWDALVGYFEAAVATDNLLVSQKILGYLKNPIWKLYILFLDFALPRFTELNGMFQSAKMSLHLLNRGLITAYQDLLSCYMKEGYWRSGQGGLQDVDPSSQVNFLPLKSMYMGAKVALLLSNVEYIQRPSDVQYFLKRVQEFYVEAASQIKKRFPINSPEIAMMEVLDPDISHEKFPSLVPLASRFPNLITASKLQTLDDEWRRLRLVTLSFEQTEMAPEEFWGKLSAIKDGGGNPQFSTLCNFMHSLLSLPHANVDVERIFSSVNLIKTKTRNRLHTGTISSFLKVKDGVKAAGGCVNFSPSSNIKQRMVTEILYHENFSSDED